MTETWATARGELDLFWDDACLDHDPGVGLWEHAEVPPWIDVPEPHPESSARLRTFRAALTRGPLSDRLRWYPGRPATVTELLAVHEAEYLRLLREATNGPEPTSLEPNTTVGPGSWPAALAAAGCAIEAARSAVLRGRPAYALVRPPGHHAQPDQADGYCLLNNPALAARAALDLGLTRVAVLDWDVHHGNGTQEIFYRSPDVLTVSLHMRHGAWGPSHPQRGTPDETGAGRGAGHNANIELSLGAGDAAYLLAFDELVEPLLREFRPDALVCASGFDGSAFDPNGRHNLTPAGYREIGLRVGRLAAELVGGRLVLTQEGGYLRGYAALCLHALVEGLLGERGALVDDPLSYLPDDHESNPERTERDLDAVRAALGDHWPVLRGR